MAIKQWGFISALHLLRYSIFNCLLRTRTCCQTFSEDKVSYFLVNAELLNVQFRLNRHDAITVIHMFVINTQMTIFFFYFTNESNAVNCEYYFVRKIKRSTLFFECHNRLERSLCMPNVGCSNPNRDRTISDSFTAKRSVTDVSVRYHRIWPL